MSCKKNVWLLFKTAKAEEGSKAESSCLLFSYILILCAGNEQHRKKKKTSWKLFEKCCNSTKRTFYKTTCYLAPFFRVLVWFTFRKDNYVPAVVCMCFVWVAEGYSCQTKLEKKSKLFLLKNYYLIKKIRFNWVSVFRCSLIILIRFFSS